MPPARWKFGVLTWMGIYPLITLLLWALSPALALMPLPLATLGLSLVLVSVMTFVVMPLLTRAFRPWLTARRTRAVPASEDADA